MAPPPGWSDRKRWPRISRPYCKRRLRQPVGQRHGQLPSYKAMLDREGVAGPAEVAVVGSESEVEHQLTAIEAAGATDFNASVFGSAEDQQRTFNLLHNRVAHDRPAAV